MFADLDCHRIYRNGGFIDACSQSGYPAHLPYRTVDAAFCDIVHAGSSDLTGHQTFAHHTDLTDHLLCMFQFFWRQDPCQFILTLDCDDAGTF